MFSDSSAGFTMLRSLLWFALELVIALIGHFFSSIYHSLRRNRTSVLAFFWLGGILFGVRFAFTVEDLPSLVFAVTQQEQTLWNAIWSCCCPVLLTAFATRYSEIWVLGVSFFYAFRFSFSTVGVLLSYGSCGWLIQLLFLLPDYLLIPWLYILWLRIIWNRGHQNRVFALCFFFSILVGLFQFRVISPFLSGLF